MNNGTALVIFLNFKIIFMRITKEVTIFFVMDTENGDMPDMSVGQELSNEDCLTFGTMVSVCDSAKVTGVITIKR